MIKAGNLRERSKKGVFVHVPAYPDKYAYIGMIKTRITHTHTRCAEKLSSQPTFPINFEYLCHWNTDFCKWVKPTSIQQAFACVFTKNALPLRCGWGRYLITNIIGDFGAFNIRSPSPIYPIMDNRDPDHSPDKWILVHTPRLW